ncbi:hypothetical protein [Tomitella cavernea]|uniref:hypothetical protein n=1 Tax=Tomitella cavernea TaxID=1387982 RepID=UPI001903F38B|nr:hypothetical protein [Tomitella cavernea]
MIDPFDPFNTGWQRRLRDVERVIDTGVGMGLGVGRSLFGSDIGSALTNPMSGSSVPLTPAQFLQNAMRTVAEQFLDKRVRMRAGDGMLTLTPTALDTEVESLGLARGQFARIRATAADLHWVRNPADPATGDDPRPGLQVHVDHAEVDCRDIQLRTAYSSALEFGTIDVELRLSAHELRRLVRTQLPDLTIDIDAGGVMRASWSRAQRLGHVIVLPQVVDGNLQFSPTELRVSRLALSSRPRVRGRPRQIPGLRVRTLTVPELPWNLRLTEVETDRRTLVLRGTSDRSAGRISTIPLSELTGLVRAAVRYAGQGGAAAGKGDGDAKSPGNAPRPARM